jgi:hypothetical protein
MAVLSGSVSGNAQPDNVTSGDWTITVNGTYNCGSSTVQPFDLSSATMGSGRWVLVKATTITGYVGATVTPPTGLTVVGVSQEAVYFPGDGTTKQCVVVTLI